MEISGTTTLCDLYMKYVIFVLQVGSASSSTAVKRWLYYLHLNNNIDPAKNAAPTRN